MNDYESKKQERIKRYEELAAKNKAAAVATHTRAHEMAEVIPFGQPILIGHHSEGKDRRYREKIHRTFKKSFELDKKANYYEEKAVSAASNQSISSDDPEAITKLKEKIAAAEENQAKMRAFNKCLRAKDNDGMLALGFNQAMINELAKPDFCGRVGFADYQMTNNNSNIHRMKERLSRLEKLSTQTTTQVKHGDITIIRNVDENRLQIVFPDKPDDEIRKQLKSRGFRWSPTSGVWQRQLSNTAIWYAEDLVREINNPNKD